MKHRQTVSVSMYIENLELTNTSNFKPTPQTSPLTGSHHPQCLLDQIASTCNQSSLAAPTIARADTTFLTMLVFSPVAPGHHHPITNKHAPLCSCILSSQVGPSPLPADTFLTLPGLSPHPTHSPTICYCPSIPTPTNALFTSSNSMAAQTLAYPTGL